MHHRAAWYAACYTCDMLSYEPRPQGAAIILCEVLRINASSCRTCAAHYSLFRVYLGIQAAAMIYSLKSLYVSARFLFLISEMRLFTMLPKVLLFMHMMVTITIRHISFDYYVIIVIISTTIITISIIFDPVTTTIMNT